MIDCRFTNAGKLGRGHPRSGARRWRRRSAAGLTIYGPKTDLFVDRADLPHRLALNA